MGTIIIEALAKQLDARVEVVRNPDRDDNRIWFVTDLHSGKEQARNADDPSHPLADGGHHEYRRSLGRTPFCWSHSRASTVRRRVARRWRRRSWQARLRPVLMMAGTMFVGMLPMLLGFAEGSGECDPR